MKKEIRLSALDLGFDIREHGQTVALSLDEPVVVSYDDSHDGYMRATIADWDPAYIGAVLVRSGYRVRWEWTEAAALGVEVVTLRTGEPVLRIDGYDYLVRRGQLYRRKVDSEAAQWEIVDPAVVEGQVAQALFKWIDTCSE